MIKENPISIRNARIALLHSRAWAYILDYLPGRGLDCAYHMARQGDEMGLAIIDWILAVWALYYERRDAMPDGEVPDDYFDFSSMGPMPGADPVIALGEA